VSYFERRRVAPPGQSTYAGYRTYVREDFRRSCAYCVLAEIYAGGEENFELDHFRPQSIFPEDAKSYFNLYYSCHVCNRIKHHKWPSPLLLRKGIGFVDLCSQDFETQFRESPDGTWQGLTLSAEYTIDALRLNRPHLVELRRRITSPRYRGKF